jgi:predicted PurR-regulated permease PerM
MDKNNDVKSFDYKVLRVLILTTLFIGLIFFAYVAQRELTWFAIAAFLALAMEPAVRKIQTITHIRSRGFAAFFTLFIAFCIITFIIASLVPPIVNQTQGLIRSGPSYIEKLQHSNNGILHLVNKYGGLSKLKVGTDTAANQVSGHTDLIIGTVSGFGTGVVALITILVLAFFMSLEGPILFNSFWAYQPQAKRKHRQWLAHEMHSTVTGYVNGNLLTSLIAAVSVTIVLTILRLPYAISLGLLVGLVDLIPLVGATIAAIVVVLLSLLYGGIVKAIIVLIFFIIYQQIENHTLQPLVYKRTVRVSALLVLTSSIIGASLAGLVGALVAIPIAASLKILVKDYLENHRV